VDDLIEHHRARHGLGRYLVVLYAAFVGEHAYGAARYGTPIRLVGILPLGLLLVLALWLLTRHARTGGRLALSAGAIIVAVGFIGLAGVFEGGFNHALKLAFYFAGTSDDRLQGLFGGPNFVVPNDVMFEGVGTATLVLAVPVATHLGQLLRFARSPKRNAWLVGAGALTTALAVAGFGGYLADPVGHAGLLALVVVATALGLALVAVSAVDGQAGRSSRIVRRNRDTRPANPGVGEP
jgi:hypothetical protein